MPRSIAAGPETPRADDVRPSTRAPGFRRVLDDAARAARSRANVLLIGETGTGKNRLARYIHAESPCASGPLVTVPCANLSPELIESELFGHEVGAFTGATERRYGRFEQAREGTLFFDELEELSTTLQAKVLRAIQERRIERLGSRESVDVDVRLLASISVPPETLVDAGRLRADLAFRLDVVRLELPPLRERKGDIPELAAGFLSEIAARDGLSPRSLGTEAIDRLVAHDWPGNLTELRNAVEAAAVLSRSETIGVADLPRSLSVASQASLGTAAREGITLRELERRYIEEVLDRTGGNKTAAAAILGIHRKTLHEKLRAYARRPARSGDDP